MGLSIITVYSCWTASGGPANAEPGHWMTYSFTTFLEGVVPCKIHVGGSKPVSRFGNCAALATP